MQWLVCCSRVDKIFFLFFFISFFFFFLEYFECVWHVYKVLSKHKFLCFAYVLAKYSTYCYFLYRYRILEIEKSLWYQQKAAVNLHERLWQIQRRQQQELVMQHADLTHSSHTHLPSTLSTGNIEDQQLTIFFREKSRSIVVNALFNAKR